MDLKPTGVSSKYALRGNALIISSLFDGAYIVTRDLVRVAHIVEAITSFRMRVISRLEAGVTK